MPTRTSLYNLHAIRCSSRLSRLPLDHLASIVAYCARVEMSGSQLMKIYSLEFVSTREGVPERIWHTNRRALERYSKALENGNYHVRGIRSHELPTPLTEARVVAFLNTHCADFLPPTATGRTPTQRKKRRTPGVGSG